MNMRMMNKKMMIMRMINMRMMNMRMMDRGGVMGGSLGSRLSAKLLPGRAVPLYFLFFQPMFLSFFFYRRVFLFFFMAKFSSLLSWKNCSWAKTTFCLLSLNLFLFRTVVIFWRVISFVKNCPLEKL